MEACHLRADSRAALGDLDGAIADYSEAIRLDPDNAFPYNNRGDALYQQQGIEGAMKDYREAIRCNPQYAVTLLEVGGLLSCN